MSQATVTADTSVNKELRPSFLSKYRNIIVEIITALFILLFVYAAVSKFIDHQRFTAQIRQTPFLKTFAVWIAWVIPIVEIVISIMLAIPRLRSYGLYSSFSLMLLFTSYIIVITKFSSYIPCSCGGVLEKMSWNQHLVFNIFFTFIAVIGIWLNKILIQKSRGLQLKTRVT